MIIMIKEKNNMEDFLTPLPKSFGKLFYDKGKNPPKYVV